MPYSYQLHYREVQNPESAAATGKTKITDFQVLLDCNLPFPIVLFQTEAKAKREEDQKDKYKLAKMLKLEADKVSRRVGSADRTYFGFLCSGTRLRVSILNTVAGGFYSLNFLPSIELLTYASFFGNVASHNRLQAGWNGRSFLYGARLGGTSARTVFQAANNRRGSVIHRHWGWTKSHEVPFEKRWK